MQSTHLERVNGGLVFNGTVDLVYSVLQLFKMFVKNCHLQSSQPFIHELLHNLRMTGGKKCSVAFIYEAGSVSKDSWGRFLCRRTVAYKPFQACGDYQLLQLF